MGTEVSTKPELPDRNDEVDGAAAAEPATASPAAEETYAVIEGNCRVAAVRHILELMARADRRRTRRGSRRAGLAPPQSS